MVDVIVVFDSLRKDVGDTVLPDLLKTNYIKFNNCFTHCGWTPYALAHLFSGKQPRQDKVLLQSKERKKAYIWRKWRDLDTESLKLNYVNDYDSCFWGLFEWSSLTMLHSFYNIKKKGVTKKTYNRYIDESGLIKYPFDNARRDIEEYLHSITNKQGDHLIFIRAMSTHAPYWGEQGVLNKIQGINFENNIHSTPINARRRQEIHTLYKTLIHEDYIINGEKPLLQQQGEGLRHDFEKLVEPIINALVSRKGKFRLLLLSDHGEIFTKYFHLQGHAHYFNKDVANVPLYYLSSSLSESHTNNSEIFLSDLLPLLRKFRSEELNNPYHWNEIIHESFQFHCKDDFLFESENASTDLFRISSTNKGINHHIRISNGIKLTFLDDPSNNLNKYLTDKFIISESEALRISSKSYTKSLKYLERTSYAKSFITHNKSKTS